MTLVDVQWQVAEQNGELQREPPGLLPYGERASPLFPTPMGDSGGDSDNITMTFRPMANTCDICMENPIISKFNHLQMQHVGRGPGLSHCPAPRRLTAAQGWATAVLVGELRLQLGGLLGEFFGGMPIWPYSQSSRSVPCSVMRSPSVSEAAGPLERALAEAAQTGRGLQERDGMTMSAPPPRYTAGYLPNVSLYPLGYSYLSASRCRSTAFRHSWLATSMT